MNIAVLLERFNAFTSGKSVAGSAELIRIINEGLLLSIEDRRRFFGLLFLKLDAIVEKLFPHDFPVELIKILSEGMAENVSQEQWEPFYHQIGEQVGNITFEEAEAKSDEATTNVTSADGIFIVDVEFTVKKPAPNPENLTADEDHRE